MKSSGSFLSCVKFRRSPTFKDSSKCGRLIELARHRIANLSSRTKSMISLSCEDTAQLLQLGMREKALLRVEQVYEDQHRISAYAQIDGLCSAMLIDFDIISKQRELPSELKVVVCTLIFAASRYGELPELNKIRNLFREWWGDELITTNVNLLPGNFVNSQIKEILIVNPMPDDAKKLELITEIARNHNVDLGFGSNEHIFKSQNEEDKHDDVYKNVQMKTENYDELSSRTSDDGSNRNEEEEIVYLDNNKRLKSPPPPPYQIHSGMFHTEARDSIDKRGTKI